MSKNRILPFEAILSKSGESWVVGGVASNFFRDLDGDAIAPDAIARAIPAFMANRGPDGLKGGPLRLHHGFWERFLKQSINSLNIPYADQMGMLAAIALPLGRVTEMTVEPDGTTRWRGLLSQANPIAKVIWEMLKEGLVHLGVSVGGKINATQPGRDALGRPCTVICDVRLDELSITDNPANRLIESESADNGAYIMALAKSLQTTVSPSPVDQFLEQVLGDDLAKAARQKMQEGATRMKNGRQQVLKNSRWRNTEPRGKRSSQHWGNTLNDGGGAPAAKPARKPRAKAAPQQLSPIPDGTPSKLKPKARKGKEWGAKESSRGASGLDSSSNHLLDSALKNALDNHGVTKDDIAETARAILKGDKAKYGHNNSMAVSVAEAISHHNRNGELYPASKLEPPSGKNRTRHDEVQDYLRQHSKSPNADWVRQHENPTAGAAFGNLRPKGQPAKATVMGEGNIKAWADKNLEDEPKDSAKRDQKAKGAGKNTPYDDAIQRMVATGNHTEASAKAALEWAAQPREGAEMEMKKNILRQAGFPVPGESSTESKSPPKPEAGAKPKAKRTRKAKAKGGELTLTPKVDKNRSRRTKQGDIDEQYASAAPSDDHVTGWLKASLDNYLDPPMGDIEADVIHERKKVENLENPENIHTLDQLTDALVASEQKYKATHFQDKEMTAADFGLFMYEKELKTAERRMKTGKTEASRAKAKKEFERLSASKKESEEWGAAAAARMNAKHSTPPEQRRVEILQELKRTAQKKLSERHALRDKVNKGRKSAVNEAQRAILNSVPAFRQHIMAGKVDLQEHVRDPLKYGGEAIKEHLQQAHQKNGGDREILGLQNSKSSAQELKQAYRQAARANHPDQGGSREKFDQIRGAYERLMDEHYPDLKKSLIPYISKTTMANVNRFLHKALGGSPGGEANSGSWRDTAIPSMGRGLAANPTNKPTGTKQVRLDSSSSDTAARGIGGKQPKAQRTYSSGGMPPTDVWGMTVGQLTRELSKCCGMGKEAWGSPETSGFLTDAAHGLVGLTESPNPELINFVRFLQYMNQFAQQLPHMDDYQAAGTVAAMNTDLTKALGDFTAALPAELKGRPLRPPGSPGVRGIDIQFPSQYIVYS